MKQGDYVIVRTDSAGVPEFPECPRCGSSKLYTNDLVVTVNTGASWRCEECGQEINTDGTPNEVLLDERARWDDDLQEWIPIEEVPHES
jgi:transcription elongation factor Elf1